MDGFLFILNTRQRAIKAENFCCNLCFYSILYVLCKYQFHFSHVVNCAQCTVHSARLSSFPFVTLFNGLMSTAFKRMKTENQQQNRAMNKRKNPHSA